MILCCLLVRPVVADDEVQYASVLDVGNIMHCAHAS